MTDFNMLPLQMQLFGGQNTAWEPLGQEGNLKPYQQQMGYDLYSKVFTDFNADRFRSSITSDPARMQQAEQLFTQIDSMQFKSMSPYDGMQRGWTSGNSWAQGAGYDFGQPQLGAGTMNPALSGNPNIVAQREAAFQGGTFGGSAFGYTPMSAPNWGGSSPYATWGGSRVDVSQFSPEAQQQIWNAMGAGGSVGGGAGDPAETISRLAKVMKEELTPAAEGVTKQMSSLVGAMRGDGGSGGGGFGGGGGTGFGGGNDDWFNGQVRPDVLNAQLARGGFGSDMPRFDDESSGFNIRPLPLFRMRQANSLFINPMMQDMNSYMTQTAKQDVGMLQSGMMDYSTLMSGQYGDIQRREVAGQEWTYNLGKQVYNAYGGIANSVLGGDAANGVLGAAVGIGAPAVGIGMMGGAIGGMVGLGGPLGLLAGGGAAILAAGNYASNASNDYAAIGKYQAGGRRMGDLFNNFEGITGDTVNFVKGLIGTDGPEATKRNQNAGAFYNLEEQYSSGAIDRQSAMSQAQGLGFTGGEVVTAGQNDFFSRMASKGLTRDQTANNLSYWQKYNNNWMPTGAQFEQVTALTLAGANIPAAAQAMAGAYGWNTNNAGEMGIANQGVVDVLTPTLQNGGNVGLASDQLTATAEQFKTGNYARRQAGLPQLNPTDYQGDLYQRYPELLGSMDNASSTLSGYTINSPWFAKNVADPTLRASQAMREFGAADGNTRWNLRANQLEGALPTLDRMATQAGIYGGQNDRLGNAMQMVAGMSPEDQNLAVAIAGGDKWALSQHADELGDERLRTIDTKTGMPIRYNGVSRKQYNMMKTDQSDLFRLSFDQAQGGEKDWDQKILNSQRGLDLYQYQEATAGRNISQLTQTGGAYGVNAQGFAMGGDGLAGLSQLFQSQGMNLQTGNGMGMWQVQDAQTAISREKQQYGFDQQGKSMVLSNQQWNESFALNQQQFNLSTSNQRNEMNISRTQQQAQEGWQQEDLGLSRNKMELQFGWQMEDFDRNIRFARGRQRIDLQREQERSTIMHGLDETGQDNQEERFKTEQTWNKEEFDRKKTYFEQSKTLAQQEMDLNKKHHDETQAMNQQAHEKEKQWMTQEFGLQDQQRLLTRQSDELQYKMATDMAIAVETTRQHIIPYQDALKASGLEYQEQEGHIKMLTMDMSVLAQWLDVVHGKVNSMTGNNNSGGGKGPTPTPYITSANHPDEVSNNIAGSTSSGSVGLLTEIRNHLRAIEAMGPGRVNATIYTNDNQVKTSNLYQKSLRTVN